MKKYIFFTNDGYTTDKDGIETNNSQILGWSEGATPEEALSNLIDENKFLKEVNYEDILCQELMDGEVKYYNLRN